MSRLQPHRALQKIWSRRVRYGLVTIHTNTSSGNGTCRLLRPGADTAVPPATAKTVPKRGNRRMGVTHEPKTNDSSFLPLRVQQRRFHVRRSRFLLCNQPHNDMGDMELNIGPLGPSFITGSMSHVHLLAHTSTTITSVMSFH